MTELSGPFIYSSALGGGECTAGTFHVDLSANGMQFLWSDGMFEVHGYKRGEVVPSLELLYAHKHPEDRARCQEIVAQVLAHGGNFCMYHRVIDAHGRLKRVLTSGDAVLDAAGKVVALEGVMVDMTSTLQRETEQSARDAVAGATATRSIIDQARGIVMARLGVGSEEAFQVLVSTSSHRNVKLTVVAEELVGLANSPGGRQYLEKAVRAIEADVALFAAGRRRAG